MDEKGMRFSPRKYNCNTSCYVLGCRSNAKKNPTLRYHAIPKAGKLNVEITNKLNKIEKIDLRQVWVRRLKISENFKCPVVCSLHFTENNYYLTYK